jgi:hypothetical protein
MRYLIQSRFLRLLFTGILLLLVSGFNSPIAFAENLLVATNTTPQPTLQTLLPTAERPQGGVVTCAIARSIILYEQPSETAKQTATVFTQGKQTQLVLAEGDGNETWLHVAQVNYASGVSQPLSGYAFNDLKATPQQSSSAIVACAASKPVPLSIPASQPSTEAWTTTIKSYSSSGAPQRRYQR